MKNLRAAIFQGHARKQPVVRHTQGWLVELMTYW
jgi:hypothetical protein